MKLKLSEYIQSIIRVMDKQGSNQITAEIGVDSDLTINNGSNTKIRFNIQKINKAIDKLKEMRK